MFHVGLLVAAFSVSATNAGPDAARMLLLNADSCEVSISMKSLTTNPTELAKLDDDRKKALVSIEECGNAAINSAGDSAEIKTAVKDFYAVADSYCKNPTNAGMQDFDSKDKTLDKLLESAGR